MKAGPHEPSSPEEAFDPATKVVDPEVIDPGRRAPVRCLMQVLWPAFLGAAVNVGVLFSLVDPMEIDAVHEHLGGSRELAYTFGFIVSWFLHAFACALAWFLSSTESRTGPL